MSTLVVDQVAGMLCERSREKESAIERAKRVYSDCLLAREHDEKAARKLLAAMDELELGAADLQSDARVVSASDQMERRIAQLQEARRKAADAVKQAELALHEAQRSSTRQGYERIVEVAHATVAEAQEAHAELEREYRVASDQLLAIRRDAPRVYPSPVQRGISAGA